MKDGPSIPLDDTMVMYLDTPEIEVQNANDKVVHLRQPTQFTDATHFIITTVVTSTRKYLVRGRNAINAVDTLLDPSYVTINTSKLDTHPEVRIEPIPDEFTLADLKKRYPDFT